MCEPATAAGMFLASGAFGAFGALQGAAAEEDLNRRNAELAAIRAEDVMALAQFDIADVQDRVARLIGSSRVGYAKGAVLDQDTPSIVAEDYARSGNIDVQLILANAVRERWGIRQQGVEFDARAHNAHAAGTAGAIGSVFGGAADAFGAYT